MKRDCLKNTVSLALLVSVIFSLTLNIYSNPIMIGHSTEKKTVIISFYDEIDFIEEEVSLHLTKEKWDVSGLYTFSNSGSTNKTVMIRYPVASFGWGYLKNNSPKAHLEDTYPKLNIEFVSELSHSNAYLSEPPSVGSRKALGEDVGSTHFLSGRSDSFTLYIPADGTVVCQISYSLNIPDNPPESIIQNKEILKELRTIPLAAYYTTTAQSWRKPIKKANFRLTVDNDIAINHLSYPEPNVEKTSDPMS